MLRYLIYCDFSTLKCDKQMFAKFLQQYTDDFHNLNDDIWIVNINNDESPFHNDLSTLVADLENCGYATRNTVIFCAEYTSLNYRLLGMDESVHVD